MLRPLMLRFALFVGLALVALQSVPPSAAQEISGEQRQLADEFDRQVKLWQQSDDPEVKIAALKAALKLEPWLQPWPLQGSRQEVKGALSNGLGLSYVNRREGNLVDNLHKAVAAYEDALGAFAGALPQEWAENQVDLGLVYLKLKDLELKEREDDLERAIAAFEAALTVYVRNQFPEVWAEIQVYLGVAFGDRVRGGRAENLEKAIAAGESALQVITREGSPQLWAETQYNLGIVYYNRISGEHADNLEKAIAAYELALPIFAREGSLERWAVVENNLGIVYSFRIRGERAENLDKAIAAYALALTVRTQEASPQAWAETQNNLGIAYAYRIRGDRAENVEKAIAAYESALQVFTPQGWPELWADAQNNLGVVYSFRLRGERADNLEKAIAAHESALQVFTREDAPQQWADAQANLGVDYSFRIRGERANNIERAISADGAALQILTREGFPQHWADVQSNLGLAYSVRIRGERADNVEKAIAAYEAALTVRTREASPRDHLRTGRLLGQILFEKHDWAKASATFASARDAFLLLFGQGLEAQDARDLIFLAGPIFPELAYAATERGDLKAALTFLNEGKARMLDVALRRQLPGLTPADRMRLAALTVEIREWARLFETARGAEAAKAFEHLAPLRRELAGLIEAELRKEPAADTMAVARALLSGRGAIVAPIVTEAGGKMLIVTAAESKTAAIDVLDLPELTTRRLDSLMRGDPDSNKFGGWRADYEKSRQLESVESSIDTLEILQKSFFFKNDAELKQKRAERDRLNREWRAAIEAIGPQLWGLFGSTLAEALAKHGVKPGARIIWLPTGSLGLLPLGLTEDPQSKRRFTDTYDIVYAPGLDALARAKRRAAKPGAASLAIVGDATGGLPFAKMEATVVAAHFPADATVKLDNANPQMVLAALPGTRYWHFASHGKFDWDDARKSALLLPNGTLTVGDLITAAEAGVLGQPRLVVLSACESGLYDIGHSPDEFTGLSGAFMALGAEGVLSTLWPVADHATMLLVTKFYDLHLGEGLAPPRALKRAQEWLRTASKQDLINYAHDAATRGKVDTALLADLDEAFIEEAGQTVEHGPQPGAPPLAHPYYWGGFIYMGL